MCSGYEAKDFQGIALSERGPFGYIVKKETKLIELTATTTSSRRSRRSSAGVPRLEEEVEIAGRRT
jgi:hypothetical protein